MRILNANQSVRRKLVDCKKLSFDYNVSLSVFLYVVIFDYQGSAVLSYFRKRIIHSSPHPAVSLLDLRESFVALAQVVNFDQVVLRVIGAVVVEDHEVVI